MTTPRMLQIKRLPTSDLAGHGLGNIIAHHNHDICPVLLGGQLMHRHVIVFVGSIYLMSWPLLARVEDIYIS